MSQPKKTDHGIIKAAIKVHMTTRAEFRLQQPQKPVSESEKIQQAQSRFQQEQL